MNRGTKNLNRTAINELKMKRLFRNRQDIESMLNNTSDISFSVCPYSITLGAINTSEAGYRNRYSKPIDFTTFQRCFNGRGSIIAEWDNSTTLAPKDETTIKGYWEVIFKVGVVFKGMISDNRTGSSFEPSPQMDSATAQQSSKSVTLLFALPDENSGNWEQNEILINNLYNEEFRFYRIPEYENAVVKDGNIYDYTTNKQWFYISGASIVYDIDTKKQALIEVTFDTVNNKIVKSGFAVVQYIQNGAPGAPYAEPKLDMHKEIVLDPLFLNPKPITHADINFYGNTALNSVIFFGREIEVIRDDNHNIIGHKVFAPRVITPYKYQAPQYDQVNYYAIPTANYFALIEATPMVEGFLESYKQKIVKSYNLAAGEIAHFEGFIKTDETKTTATNAITSPATQHLPFWDNAFIEDKSKFTDEYSTLGSEYYYANPNANPDAPSGAPLKLGITSLKYSDLEILPATTGFSLGLYNFLNGTIFKQVQQLPTALEQNTPFALSSLPGIGGFLNKITLGLPLGFKQLNVIDLPTNIPVPLLCPIQTYNAGLEQWASDLLGPSGTPITDPAKDKGLLVFDLFRTDTPDTPAQLYGTNTITSAFAFNLTDQIKLKPTDLSNNEFDNNPQENISTMHLGQFNTAKDKMYLINKSVELVDPTSVFNPQPLNQRGYIIDSMLIHAVQKSDYKITFFSQPANYSGDIDNNNAVYTGTWSSISKVSNNGRQWQNFNQLSYPLYDFLATDKFDYPRSIINPIPVNTPTIIRNYDITWNNLSIVHNGSSSVSDYPNNPKISTLYTFSLTDFVGTSATIQTIPDYSIDTWTIKIPFTIYENGGLSITDTTGGNQIWDYGDNHPKKRIIYNGVIEIDHNNTTTLNFTNFPEVSNIKQTGGTQFLTVKKSDNFASFVGTCASTLANNIITTNLNFVYNTQILISDLDGGTWSNVSQSQADGILNFKILDSHIKAEVIYKLN